MNTPPRSGPRTAATQYVIPIMPIIIGRFVGRTVKDTILVPPTDKPAPPKPAMALPMINVFEVDATPQIKLPISKISIEPRKLHLRL